MATVCVPKKAGNTEFVCYFQLATMIISGKWKPRVLYELVQNEVSRFGELRKSVVGITEKMLIQILHVQMAQNKTLGDIQSKVGCLYVYMIFGIVVGLLAALFTLLTQAR